MTPLSCSLAVALLAAPAAGPTAASPEGGSRAAASPAGDPQLAALVHRVVEAYGGRAALERLGAASYEGATSSIALGGTGRLRRVFERPRRLRVTIEYARSKEERVLDGARGWRDGREVSGAYLHAMLLQAARLDLPLALLEGLPALEDAGTVELAGRPLRAVRLPVGRGMSLTVDIDPESGRILRAAGRADEEGQPLQLSAVYSDFRRVQGVLVPFREESFARGTRTGETVLTHVELLPRAPAGSFKP